MKLASQRHGRDGRLILVSRDLKRAVAADHIAPTLQDALDRWDEVTPALKSLYAELNQGRLGEAFDFDPRACSAPLPRAPQWLDASTYGAHGKLIAAALKLEKRPAAPFPLLLQCMPGAFLGPYDDEPLLRDDVGQDFEGEVGVITGAVRAGATPTECASAVRLVVMLCDWTLRGMVQAEVPTGFGLVRAKAPVSFAPVAVTPGELGDAWRDSRLFMTIKVEFRGRQWGHVATGGMDYGFDRLISEAASYRALLPGTIIGSGSISEGAPERVGSSNIVEVRGFEILNQGEASTEFATWGDHLKLDIVDDAGESVFGTIEQTLVKA